MEPLRGGGPGGARAGRPTSSLLAMGFMQEAMATANRSQEPPPPKHLGAEAGTTPPPTR